jgi:hypothetical protein
MPHQDLETKRAQEALGVALEVIGVDRNGPADDFRLHPDQDPLGELDGEYKAVLSENEGWSEEALRVERIKAVLRPLIDSLKIATSLDANVDPYFDRPDVLLLKRLISSTDSQLRRYLTSSTLSKADPSLIFSDLLRFDLPIGELDMEDIVSIRRDGQFAVFRQALRNGLRSAASQSFEEFLYPHSMKLSEIRAELIDAHEEARREWRRSSWMRRNMPDSIDLAVAVVAGSVGALASTPLLGAASGASLFILTQLIEWLKSRNENSPDAFSHHVALFEKSAH